MSTNNETNGRGDAPNPDFVGWKFASEEDERLLLSWLAGSKAGPLVIVGPHRSGKSRLLNHISQALNDGVPPCAWNALPKRKEEFIWLKMNDGHCLVIDDCWASPAGGDVIERIIQMMADGGRGVKVRKPYSTTEIIQTRANGVLVVAAVAQSAERVLEAKKMFPHFRDAVVVRLAV